MKNRALIVPAAGAGSRLGASLPKALVPVAGVPMLGRVLALYEPYVSSVVVVASSAAQAAIAMSAGAAARIVVQADPTGMLDAILLAASEVPDSASSVWITWCDQVAVEPETVRRLAAFVTERPDAAIIMPTVRRSEPYIHLQRGSAGAIVGVLHRREGDTMPDVGESDMGLFALSRAAYRDMLPSFAAEARQAPVTAERNFLPFIAWAAARASVATFPCTHPMEALGVNTPEELAAVEIHLRQRGRAG